MRVLIAFCLATTLAQAYDFDHSTIIHPLTNLPEWKHLIDNDDFISRILGGQDANLHQFPYQVGTFLDIGVDYGRAFCGGSLLNDEWVLTAGHCVYTPGNITVVLGAHNITAVEPHQLAVEASEAFYHEDFNPNNLENDIGLIRLAEKVKFNEWIQPVRLPTASEEFLSFEGFNAIVSGWGLNNDSATKLTQPLQWVDNIIISNTECIEYFADSIKSGNICMSGAGGRSTCYGDSGGPLVIVDFNGEATEIGIVSYGSATCEEDYPGIYTRVTSYLSWISNNTGIPIEL